MSSRRGPRDADDSADRLGGARRGAPAAPAGELANGGAAELFRAIGARVRTYRRAAHLTLDELSARSGVSRRMITMLEAGGTNVSLGTLDKLARALDVEFAALVAVRPVPTLIPEATRSVEPVWSDGRGSAARLLDSRVSARVVELWYWELVPAARYEADADPPGSEELLLVHAGQLVAEVGDAGYTLEEGQHLRLPTDVPYAYANPGRKIVRFTRVVAIP